MLVSTFLTLASLASLSTAGYVLEDDYEPTDEEKGGDPTNGYVTYVDEATALQQGLINTNGPVYIGVDDTNIASGSGRSSVRITSTKSYNHGLIILDVAHMPGGICGTWPAFWTVGPNWPDAGEIDIIEGVNSQSTNSMTLHTNAGCSISNNGDFSGVLGTTNCDVDAAGQANNAGCQINTPSTASFGVGFNSAQGGVYATEWTSDAISIWFFPRSAIPSDVASGTPDPTTWGSATASFSGNCDIDDHFTNQQIVFDTTFCGDWAGNVWAADPLGSSKAATCREYVQNNPSDFTDAYWSINSLKVYQANGATPSSVPAISSAFSAPATIGSSLPTGSAMTGLNVPVPIPTSVSTVPVEESSTTTTLTPFESFGSAAASTESFSDYSHSHSHSHNGGGGYWSGTNTAFRAVMTPLSIEAHAVISTPTDNIPTSAQTTNDIDVAAAQVTTTPSNPITTPSNQLTASAPPAPSSTQLTTSAPSIPSPPSSSSSSVYITVSAEQTDQFPSHNGTQARGTDAKNKRGEGHLRFHAPPRAGRDFHHGHGHGHRYKGF